MKKYINPQKKEWEDLVSRPTVNAKDLSLIVDQVFNEVKMNGDKAIEKYTHFYDKVDLKSIEVSQQEIKEATSIVNKDLKSAIKMAASNIECFHQSQLQNKKIVETSLGVECWQDFKPIEKVGLYIPGGSAPLFSTVLMLAIPAKLAGCKEVVLCTPPNNEGKIAKEILFAANYVGVSKILKVGGIQAIAGLTYGTDTIPKVFKIFGPGNQYVTAAKQRAFFEGIAIDMPAGPSELLVVADESCFPEFVASDLLSQAEHGADSQVICLINNEALLNKINIEIENQLKNLPRKEIATKALKNSKFIVFNNEDETIDFVNEYAPEHLILAVKNENKYLDKVVNAGSVFIGNYTPESAGDYASGTNHTLPTNGFSRAFSGVNMDAYLKKITYQKISKDGIKNIGKSIELMAEAEQLQGHKNAVTVRLNSLND